MVMFMKQKMMTGPGPNMQPKSMETAKKAEATARMRMPIFSITGEGSCMVSIRLYNTQATRMSPVYKFFISPEEAMAQLRTAAAHPDAKGIQIAFENINGGKAHFKEQFASMEGFKVVEPKGTGQTFLMRAAAPVKMPAEPMTEAPMA